MSKVLNKDANIYLVPGAQFLTEADLKAIYNLGARLGDKSNVLIGAGEKHYTKLYNLSRYTTGFVTKTQFGYFGFESLGRTVYNQLIEEWGHPVPQKSLFEFAKQEA